VVALGRRGLGNLSGADFRHKLTGRHFRQAVEKMRVAGFHFLTVNHGLIMTPSPLPPTYCIRVWYTVHMLIHTGRVESLSERRLKGQQFTKLGPKYQHDCLYHHSINHDKQHLPQSPSLNPKAAWNVVLASRIRY
jgi:hypothetical protein